MKKLSVPLICILCVVICLALTIGLACWQMSVNRQQMEAPTPTPSQQAATGFNLGPLEYDPNASDKDFSGMTQEEIQKELNEKVEEGMININACPNPIFEDGKSAGNLNIRNSAKNRHPQVVIITRNDTGEEIYRSGAIAVGDGIEYAPLNVDLPAGDYECTMSFHSVNVETGAVLGTGKAIITVTVLN